MKKLLILFLFFSLIGCNTIGKNKQASSNFNCPVVFFSSEDRIFVDTSKRGTSIDDILLKAELNNFGFNDKCYEKNDVVVIPLDILIIAQPMDGLENQNVSIPLYTVLLDQNDEVLETQYFMVNHSITKTLETNNFLVTDIAETIYIITKNLDTNQIVIGFMLDKEKKSLIN